MNFMKTLGAVAALGLLAACSSESQRDTSVPLRSVAQVDLDQYVGKWYEVARYPFFFEEGCVASTAEYSKRDDGKIKVVNTCRQETFDGQVQQSIGHATPLDETNARLSVSFVEGLDFPTPNYVIMGLTQDYSLAVIGNPEGTTGWILSRTSTITDAQKDWATGVMTTNGYDLDQLIWTPQP